jgi:hypothetical protein
VPLNGWYDGVTYQGPVTSYARPAPAAPGTTTRRVITKKPAAKTTTEKPAVTTPEKPAPTPPEENMTPAEGSSEEPTPAKPKNDEPTDTDPTGRPALETDEPPAAGLNLNPAAGAVQEASRDRHA